MTEAIAAWWRIPGPGKPRTEMAPILQPERSAV
jgi:hypothetical protein